MDENQARSALDEVERRRGEAARLAGRQSAPTWYGVVLAVVVLGLTLQSDLRELNPGWDGWFARWGLSLVAVAVLVVSAVVVHRRAAVTAHRTAVGAQIATVAIVVVAFYLSVMAIGMPMRYHRIPFDQTVSVVGGAVVVAAGWLVWRRVRARRG